MEKRELIELILSDLSSKTQAAINEMIAKSPNHAITQSIKDSILEIHGLSLAHSRAYESLCGLLALSYKHSIKYVKSGNNIDVILNKISALSEDIRGVRAVEEFYETLANFEVSIHTLEAIGEVKLTKVVS